MQYKPIVLYNVFRIINKYKQKGSLKMKNNKFETLSKKELLNTNGGGKVIGTDVGHYPREWGKKLGQWIGSKIK